MTNTPPLTPVAASSSQAPERELTLEERIKKANDAAQEAAKQQREAKKLIERLARQDRKQAKKDMSPMNIFRR